MVLLEIRGKVHPCTLTNAPYEYDAAIIQSFLGLGRLSLHFCVNIRGQKN